MPDLRGKVAVVTGGAQGLGEATCGVLSDAGASVVVADVQEERAEEVADAIRRSGGKASALYLDVSDELGAAELVHRTLAEHGRIDVLVNGAGVDVTGSVEEISFDEWDRVLAVNLRGAFVLAKTVFPFFRQQGGGHVVNVVSTAARRAWANASAHHASKWGLLGLSRALHVEGRQHGIRVTAVIAGGMRTPSLLERVPETDPGVLQDPRHVAETIRYVLTLPEETVIPEMTVIPLSETSWP